MSPARVEADVDSDTYDMLAQCGAGDQLKLQIEPPQYTYEIVVSFVGEPEV
jgi:hypothetical protein